MTPWIIFYIFNEGPRIFLMASFSANLIDFADNNNLCTCVMYRWLVWLRMKKKIVIKNFEVRIWFFYQKIKVPFNLSLFLFCGYLTGTVQSENIICNLIPSFALWSLNNAHLTVEPRFNEPLYNKILDITNDALGLIIFKYKKNNLDVPKSRHNEHILQAVPWSYVISRFHGTVNTRI